ncbi:MAG: hypothetical protein IT314_12680 [Anaerolineales bacterium]|nr:hypothetical protein [Anaerolineales bacterium]
MIIGNRSIFRVGILLLFVLALLGPWTYDVINVPAEFTCDKPFIRLDGDFCGVPTSVIQFFSGPVILLLLPFLTTALLIWKEETQRLRTINMIVWTLAFLLTLLVFFFQIQDQAFRLWGLWLYILMSFSALAFEFLALRNSPRSG